MRITCQPSASLCVSGMQLLRDNADVIIADAPHDQQVSADMGAALYLPIS